MGLIYRQQKRSIECKVFEMKCSLQDKGFSRTLITRHCKILRKTLLSKFNFGEDSIDLKHNSHQVAAIQLKKNELIRSALKIDKNYRNGSSFNQILSSSFKDNKQKSLIDSEYIKEHENFINIINI